MGLIEHNGSAQEKNVSIKLVKLQTHVSFNKENNIFSGWGSWSDKELSLRDRGSIYSTGFWHNL